MILKNAPQYFVFIEISIVENISLIRVNKRLL